MLKALDISIDLIENLRPFAILVNSILLKKLFPLKYIKNGKINLDFTDRYIGKEHVYVDEDSLSHIYKNNTLYSGCNNTICSIYVPFDTIKKKRLFESNQFLIDYLQLCISELKEYWKIKGWDESDLDRIQQEILEEDFKLSVELLKASNDSKSYKAVINAHYFKEYCNIEIELYKKRQLLDKQLLFKAQIHTPFMFSFYKSVLGGIIWIDEDEFEIKSLFVGLVYKIKVVNDKLEFVITPENNKYDPVRFLVDSLRYGKTAEESAELYKRAMRGY